jgi:hypothetical protein
MRMPTHKPLKFKHKVEGTVYCGRWWATFRDAARLSGVPEATIRDRHRRGKRGLDLIEPLYVRDKKTRDSAYRAKVRLLARVWNTTPGDLARLVGMTTNAMRYRIKHLSKLEIVAANGLDKLTGGLTEQQRERAKIERLIKERERESGEQRTPLEAEYVRGLTAMSERERAKVAAEWEREKANAAERKDIERAEAERKKKSGEARLAPPVEDKNIFENLFDEIDWDEWK